MIDVIWAFITSYYWWGFAISLVILSFIGGLLQDDINASDTQFDEVPLWGLCLMSAVGAFIWPLIGIILFGMLPAFIGKAVSNRRKKIKNAKKTDIRNLI